MKSIMMLLINGDTFFLEDSNLTDMQKINIDNLAKQAFMVNPELKKIAETKIMSWFINEARERFEINLKSVNVSHIIRMNK